MTYNEFKKLWASLDENQRERVRQKSQWEHMGLWAVCNEWGPSLWKEANG